MAALDKSPQAIASMFARIAPRYDALNHILSFNTDRRWRRRAVAELGGAPRRVLDLATGTGDLGLALRGAGKSVVGADFCLDMLARARRKGGCELVAADALALPFPDGAFDAVTIAFGVRNFADLPRGLAEIRRVLAAGGTLLILEFSRPTGPAAGAYRLYCDRFLPWIGGLLSGARDAYAYLNRSAREWPGSEELARVIGRAGFDRVVAVPLTFGVAAIHRGERP
jgi:demethylmenaquinone methyltransferase / 2-methoxy-6-polyprenyl-1,4-benzoquinol methylase